jgi:hypothetical protein
MKKNYLTKKSPLTSDNITVKTTTLFKAVIVVCFFVFNSSFGQGATCATAETISINGACDSGTIIDTSQDNPSIGSCPGTFNREGWYTFTVAGGPQNVTITAIGNNRNIYLQLLSSTSPCTGLTQINCANTTTTNGTQTETISTILPNGIYYIKVVNVGSNGNLTLTSLCVTSPIPCTTPSAQPTALTFPTLTSTSLNGSFTAASPAPSGYLIVRSNSATPPTLTNGITYAVGSTALGAGTLVIQGSAVTSNTTSFTSGTLTSNTRYYYHIFSYNNSCTGAPFYNSSTPLSNSAITCPVAPTAPLNSTITGSGFTVSWTASAAGGNAAPIEYFLEVSTNAGFTSPIAGSPFSVGTALTYTVSGLNGATMYYYRIRAFNESCFSDYLTASATTASAPPVNNQCANATNLPCATSNLVGTTVLANSYTNGSGCLMSDYGGWYTFVGDGNSSTISVTTTNYDIKLSISSGSCGSLTNIACLDSALSSGTETYTFTTAVGVTYYVYIAYWSTAGTSTNTGTFTISRSCSVPYNPCTSISNIATCGSANSVTIPAGAGGYSPSSCGWTTPGVERIYTFTPASTGNFTITQTSSFGFIDYQFKPVSLGCSSSGWTCIDDLSGAGTSPSFTLIAGTQYYILLDPEVTTGGSVNFTINCPTPPITNDEPCNAIALTVNTTCNYSTYTNSGAAASAGIPDPGCASYSGGDVWFSAVVPAAGVLTVDLQSGVMIDSGMAFYSGACGSLTLLECDDDDSNNGAMSTISMTGLTPGQTIYIRVWEFGNNNNGTFGICATTPSCPAPSDLYATILNATSATINWNNTTPPSSNGYQYYITTTNTPPTPGSTPTGSTAAGVNGVTLTGLVAGQAYYFWVRSFCGGTDYSSWYGPTNYTPCAVGNGTGTTTLDCPSVVSGGLGLNGGTPPTMSCQALGCVDLEATYLQINQPTNYSVSSIPYAPPYQFTCLQNPVSVNVDDIWSPMINLPFNFCFYGNNYNQCLIGSNGVITFDTTTYAPGGYNSWSFSNDLPNASLLRNTIFGVYHDIDPSAGGQVGWELITLNTGCRALVAAWNDIPMFSSTCNTQLYTGMIVLYENTNVIEVYVKEKSTCATWNSGNAIVGIQNGAGTAAVVAPNRNGLSADWTVTNEAWRFTPTGTTLTTLKWFEGNGTSGTQIGTTNSINVCPTVTTIYTAEVTYALCNGTNLKYTDNVVVNINGNKIWNGGTNTNWNEGSNWTPSGVPTSANCVVIPDVTNDPAISNTPNALGHNLSVHNNAQLTMNAGQNLIITDKITVQPNAIFTVNNNANLIQINDSAVNTGSIRYKRIAPNIKGSDYVYWSSPVNNQDIGTIYDSTFPYNSGFKFQWNTTLNNTNGASGNISQGRWEAASGIMTMGRGYIIRGSSSFGMPASNIPTTFTGVPFNGAIPYTVHRGSYTGAPYNGANGVQITNLNDNYNLIGNPYPSSINALKFLQTNAYDASTNPTGRILGNLKLWTHGTDPVPGGTNPFYGSFQYNYDANDYLTINYLGSTTPGSVDLIRAGQAFFVQMIDGAAGSGTVSFNNSMRYDATLAPYSNSGFFKNANTVNSEFTIERHRLWLDLVDSNSQSSGILVGYAADATNEYDNLFDAPTAIPSGLKLFSTITNDSNIFEIQGRSLPFDINDEIPIGINVPTQGNYSFAIGALDGLFEDQNIYLKDTMLNITHDLKLNPYTFTTSAGVTLDRFKIVYINNALGNPNYSIDNAIKVLVNNEIAVSSSNLQMESIEVFNVLGQKLQTYNNINDNYFTLLNLNKNNTTLLLRIKLQTGETVIEKIIY